MQIPHRHIDNDNRSHCQRCDSSETKLGAGKAPHTASLVCAECDRWIKWVGKKELAKLGEMR